MSETEVSSSLTEDFINDNADGEVSIFADEYEEASEAEEETEEESEEGSEEESEEESEGSEEEGSEEEEQEEEEEEGEEDSTDWEGMVATLQSERENINHALTAERTKRKEATDRSKQLELELGVAKNNSYKEQLEKVEAKIKELDLSDVIKIEKPQEIDPRIQILLDQQELSLSQGKVAEVVAQMQTTVTERVSKYSNIDVKSTKQGTILGQMIMSSINGGIDVSDAVDSALESLNSLLENTTTKAKKARTPVVKAKTKPIKAATRTKRKVSPQRKAIASGDFSELFKQMGEEMSGSN